MGNRTRALEGKDENHSCKSFVRTLWETTLRTIEQLNVKVEFTKREFG